MATNDWQYVDQSPKAAPQSKGGWSYVTPSAPGGTDTGIGRLITGQPQKRDLMQRFSDSFVKADLNGFGGWAARRILEATNGLGMVPKPAWMSDKQYKDTLHKAIISNQEDTLKGIAARDAGDKLVSGGIGDTAEHIASSAVANVAGGASPTYLIAPGGSVATRILAQGGINAANDAAMQGLQIQDDTRKEFDPASVVTSAALGALFQGGVEGLGAAANGLRGIKLRPDGTPVPRDLSSQLPEAPSEPAPAPEGPNAPEPQPAGATAAVRKPGEIWEQDDEAHRINEAGQEEVLDEKTNQWGTFVKAKQEPIPGDWQYGDQSPGEAASNVVKFRPKQTKEQAHADYHIQTGQELLDRIDAGHKVPEIELFEAADNLATVRDPDLQPHAAVLRDVLLNHLSDGADTHVHVPGKGFVGLKAANDATPQEVPSHNFSLDGGDSFNTPIHTMKALEDGLRLAGRTGSRGANDLHSAAKWFHENSTGALQEIMGRNVERLQDLKDLGYDLKLNLDDRGNFNGSGETSILSNPKQVEVRLRTLDAPADKFNPGVSPSIVAHEITHAVTMGLITAVKKRPNSPRLQAFKKPVADLQRLWSEVMNRMIYLHTTDKLDMLPEAYKRGNVAADSEELLAWGLSDKNFQDFLKTVPYQSTNAWSKFVTTVRSLLGMKPKDDNALSHLLEIYDGLTGDTEGFKSAMDIYDSKGRLTKQAQAGGEEPPVPPEEEKPPVERAGNINLSRLGTPEEVNSAIREVASEMGIDEHTTVGHEAVIDKTEKMLERWTPEQLLVRNPRLFTATPYALAVRTILSQSSRKMVDASKRVLSQEGGEEAMADLRYYRMMTGAAAERSAKVAGLAGRLLNQYNIRLDKGGHGLPPGTDDLDLESFAKVVAAHAANPKAVAAAAKESFKPFWEDYALSYWYNIRLSGLKTHIQNFVGNAGVFGTDIFEHGVASVLGQHRRLQADNLERITGREVAARLFGAWRGFTNAKTWADTAESFKAGHPIHQVSKVEQGRPIFPGALGAIETPTRALAASDQWWRGLIQSSDFAGMAVRTAYREGKTGKDFWDRVSFLEQNPTDEMLSHANNYSRVIQLVDEPSVIGKVIEAGKRRRIEMTPGQRIGRFALHMVAPFTRVTDSLIRTAIRHSPLGFMDKVNIDDFKAGGGRKDLALSRMMVGSAVIGWMGMQAFNGNITGDGPSDYRQREQLKATGWRPNSIKVGDNYYSYSGLQPLSNQANIVATLVEKWKNGEIKDNGLIENLFQITGALGSQLSENTFTQSIGQFFQMMQPGQDGVNARQNYIAGQVAGFTTPALVSQINSGYVDQAKRNTTGEGTAKDRIAGRVMAGTPGLSSKLPQKYDVFGRPELQDESVGPNIASSVKVSPIDKDPVIQEVSRLGTEAKKLLVGPVSNTLNIGGGQTRRLSASEYENYQRLAGQYTLEGIRQEMNNPDWRAMTDEDRIGDIKGVVVEARKQARDELFVNPPNNQQWSYVQ